MGCQVIFSPRSIARLEEIVRYIARENSDAALRLGMKLIDRAELLAEFPELGRPFSKRAGVRRLSVRPYLIYYRYKPAEQVVEILDFWHGARREPEFLSR